MCTVSFIGLDESVSEKDISKMVEYLNVTSVLIKAGHLIDGGLQLFCQYFS